MSRRTAMTSDDLVHSQTVIVAFRWIMVTAGFVFALWNPEPVAALRVQILAILGLAVMNFFLHTQLLRRRFALEPVVFMTSAADVALITALVALSGGYGSQLYIFYYPAMLVYAVAFPPWVTLAFTIGVAMLYAFVGGPAPADAPALQALGTRLLALVTIAVCGLFYWKTEHDRRSRAPGGADLVATRERGLIVAREAAEDLFFGQLVIVIARWALVTAFMALVLWTATDEWQLIADIVPVVALMAMNFFLHGRYLLERPANWMMTAAATLLDLLVITGVVSWWPGAQGLDSQFFVLYYPALMAVAFVFAPVLSLGYTGLAVIGYAGACLAVDPSLLGDGRTAELLVQRLTTLAAVGTLSTYYWRIQRERRRAVAG